MLFELNNFHVDLYCYVKYSSVKYQNEIFNTYH